MSVREEDRKKSSCPSRGLGLAAAALGVGVGAALYYLFSKRSENEDSEGASTSEWNYERPAAFVKHLFASSYKDSNNSSYTTISVHSTTDTSMDTDIESISDGEPMDSQNDDFVISLCTTQDTESAFEYTEDESEGNETENDSEVNHMENDSEVNQMENESNTSHTSASNSTAGHITIDDEESSNADSSEIVSLHSMSSIPNAIEVSDDDESSNSDSRWEITDSALDVPNDSNRSRSPLQRFVAAALSPILYLKGNNLANPRSKQKKNAFRERTWSLEECSICFDIILKDQEVMTLPCTHHFHQQCIMPWLQEHQTCPNCRKETE